MPDQTVREDFDKLFKILVPAARQLLEEQGEFYPFAGVVAADGQARLVAADIGQEKPNPREMVAFLTAALRAQAGNLKAIAICTDVLFPAPGSTVKTDGIQLSLEYQDGPPTTVIIPYVKVSPGHVRLETMLQVESKEAKVIFAK